MLVSKLAGVCLVAAAAVQAQTPLNCSATAGVPPLVRVEGLTETVGDIVLHCTGGTAGAQRTAGISVFLNTNVTTAADAGKPEALLLINDPMPQQQVVGSNVFQATGAGGTAVPNVVVFAGVSIPEPGTAGATTLRITNIRANANQIGIGSVLVPSQIVAQISINATPAISVANPNQVVAFVTQGLTAVSTARGLSHCEASNAGLGSVSPGTPATPSVHLQFREGFASAFKGRWTGAAGATPQAQAIPGQNTFTESMFYNPALTQLGPAGLAAHGTRLRARFTNVLPGIALYVPASVLMPSPPATWNPPRGKATLIATDANGGGAFNPVISLVEAMVNGAPTSLAALPITAGSAVAVWEIETPSPSDVEELSIPVFVSYQPNAPALGNTNVSLSFAPLSTDNLAGSRVVPRFADTSTQQAAFTIRPCSATPPDLDIPTLDAPWTVAAASPLPVTVTVRNAGSGAAGQSEVRIRLYRDPGLADPVAAGMATCDVPALPAGSAATCTRTLTAPAASPGTYYVAAHVDESRLLVESNTANNTRWQPVVVSACSLTPSPDRQDVPAAGGSYSILLNGPAACSNLVFPGAAWVSTMIAWHMGGQSFLYTVSPNTGAARKTALRIGERTFPISQAAGAACTVALSATQRSYPSSGAASESISVTAPAGCAWSASSDTNWISATSNGETGPGTYQYSVQSNNGGARSGRIYIADQEVLITQAGGNALPAIDIIAPTASSSYVTTQPSVTLSGHASDSGGGIASVSWSTSQGLAGAASGTTSWTARIPLAVGSNVIQVFARDTMAETSADTINVIYTPVPVSGEPLRFVPVQPCRVVDTREAAGPLGAPHMAADTTRSFPVPSSNCGIPAGARAYSLNVTVVPRGPLGYLSLWPAGQTKPWVSTLNSLDGRVKANAAIVPAGSGGAVNVYVQHAADVILDINGYFVAASDPAGLAFYPLTPCRVADTREASRGLLGTPSMGADQRRTFPLLASSCNIPASARAYSLNFTVVPRGFFGYLTTWPTGAAQPWVSTLNAVTGTIVANAAIVPAGNSGAIDVFTQHPADVIIDVNGYFGPPAPGGLSLYNLTPCRIFDSREAAHAPRLNGMRDIAVTAASCSVPPAARAYALNATVVPPGFMGYISLWPHGAAQPLVSTLNAIDAAITSNMAIVPASEGSIAAFSAHATELILDISGYFAP